MSAPKLVAVSIGPSECGKSQALWDFFISHVPRRLSIDINGENAVKFNRDVITTYTWKQLRDALEACAGYSEWHIALSAPPDEIASLSPKLAMALNPPKLSDEHRSYSLAVGGMSIDCSEAKYFVRNTKARWAELNLAYVERGRHNRLSVFLATQFPTSIPRSVTDSADHLLAFGTQEKAVRDYWRDNFTAEISDLIAGLPRFHCAWIRKAEMRVYLLDDRRRVLRVLDYRCNDVAA